MIWYAMRRAGERLRRLTGTALPPVMPRGTLICDIDLDEATRGGAPVLHAARRDGVPALWSLNADEDGRLTLVHRAGARAVALSVGTDGLAGPGPGAAGGPGGGLPLRVSYHWDAASGLSQLSVENPASGAIRQAVGSAPPPLAQPEAVALMTAGAAAARAVSGVAIGAGRHPVGIGACFGPDTPILTPEGGVPVHALRRGMTVITAAGPRAVRWAGRIAAPTFGATEPVVLKRPYHGRNADILVTPHHRVALSGPEVEYLFQTDTVLVEARHLAAGHTADRLTDAGTVDWYGLALDDHAILMADGCRIESLFLGGIAAAPDLVATTALAPLLREPGGLPRHRVPAARDLRDYEAATLVLNMRQRRGPVAA